MRIDRRVRESKCKFANLTIVLNLGTLGPRTSRPRKLRGNSLAKRGTLTASPPTRDIAEFRLFGSL